MCKCLPLWGYLFPNANLTIPVLVLKGFDPCPLPVGWNPNFLQRHRSTVAHLLQPGSHSTSQTVRLLHAHFLKPLCSRRPLLLHSLLLPFGTLTPQTSPQSATSYSAFGTHFRCHLLQREFLKFFTDSSILSCHFILRS